MVEKLLKAYYTKVHGKSPPPTHNLIRLTELSEIGLNEEQRKFFATVTSFNIEARYNDYKQKFYKQCTKEFTELWLRNIKKYREWIKNELLKS